MGDFEWLGRAKRKKPDGLYEIVVRQKPIGDKTKSVADDVGDKARSRLAQHTDEGHARITVDRGDKSDAFVTLSDEAGDKAAAAIEYGSVRKDGSYVPGIGALRGAIGNL